MIYLDNAATTYPKPESVYEKMDWVNRNMAVNAGRGSYNVARKATQIIDETRSQINNLVHGNGNEKVILTPSATISANIILKGLNIKQGDTIYVSPYEHNAIIRPLYSICEKTGSKMVEMPLEKDGQIDLEKLKYLFIKDAPNYICCTHVSNVTGYILPVEEIFSLGKEYSTVNILDASQSLGLVDIDVKNANADFIIFAGHKSLYGPFGCAGFIDNSNIVLNTFLEGGTGSDSLNHEMSDSAPGRYEAASKNIVAIAGLNEALKQLNQSEIYKHEKKLTEYAVGQLRTVDHVIVYGVEDEDKHIGVISFNIDGYMAEDIGNILDADFDIAVRTGYHCTPLIHNYLDDKQYLGTVRIGLGQFNSEEDIDELINALEEL